MKEKIQKATSVWWSRSFYMIFIAISLWALGDIAFPQTTSCVVGTYDCTGQLYLYNGNVGVGAVSPTYKLDVNGNLRVTDMYLTDGVSIEGLSGRNHFRDVEGAGDLRVGAAWGMPGIYAEAGVGVLGGAGGASLQNNAVFVNTSGNVGVGTSTPGAKLDVGVGASQCCAAQAPNISLAQASNTNGQMAWLQFHNAGEAEAYIRLAGGGAGARAGQRRLEIGDNQNVKTAVSATGGYIQPGAGGEPLRIIRGRLASNGAISAGSGFTVTKGGPGAYTINITTPFSDIPTFTATPIFSGTAFGVQGQANASAVSVTTFISSTGAGSDQGFNFILIGPP